MDTPKYVAGIIIQSPAELFVYVCTINQQCPAFGRQLPGVVSSSATHQLQKATASAISSQFELALAAANQDNCGITVPRAIANNETILTKIVSQKNYPAFQKLILTISEEILKTASAMGKGLEAASQTFRNDGGPLQNRIDETVVKTSESRRFKRA